MKRYLLLASVAGCLMSTNAMAGSIATDGQSAVVNVKARIVSADTISSVQDIDFGTIAVVGDYWHESDNRPIATISTAGSVTTSDADIIIRSSTPSQNGAVTFSSEAHNVSIVCAGDESLDATESTRCGCAGGSGLCFGKVTTETDGKTIKLGATAYTESQAFTVYGDIDRPAFRVTLQY